MDTTTENYAAELVDLTAGLAERYPADEDAQRAAEYAGQVARDHAEPAHNPAIRTALEAIWSALPEDPNRALGIFDHLATIDRENGGANVAARLERLRAAIRAESVSYGELAELQDLADYIEPGDVELAEPAGIPETQFHLRMVSSAELDPGDPEERAELERRARMGD